VFGTISVHNKVIPEYKWVIRKVLDNRYGKHEMKKLDSFSRDRSQYFAHFMP
jgi:hypothetical protein